MSAHKTLLAGATSTRAAAVRPPSSDDEALLRVVVRVLAELRRMFSGSVQSVTLTELTTLLLVTERDVALPALRALERLNFIAVVKGVGTEFHVVKRDEFRNDTPISIDDIVPRAQSVLMGVANVDGTPSADERNKANIAKGTALAESVAFVDLVAAVVDLFDRGRAHLDAGNWRARLAPLRVLRSWTEATLASREAVRKGAKANYPNLRLLRDILALTKTLHELVSRAFVFAQQVLVRHRQEALANRIVTRLTRIGSTDVVEKFFGKARGGVGGGMALSVTQIQLAGAAENVAVRARANDPAARDTRANASAHAKRVAAVRRLAAAMPTNLTADQMRLGVAYERNDPNNDDGDEDRNDK